MNFQMFKLDLEKAKEPEIKLPTYAGSSKKQEFQKNMNFCFIDYTKVFDCVDHNKVWKILEEMEYQTTCVASWETCMQVKKQQLELDMGQQTGSKSGKEYFKAVYCHPAYLTYMQSTSCEMPGWIKHLHNCLQFRGSYGKELKCHSPRELEFAALRLKCYASVNLLYSSHTGQMHSVDK